MTIGSLFIGWGSIIAGREKTASRVLGEAMRYLQELQADNTIESFDVVLLEPHGGELEGFVLVRAQAQQLALLRVDPAFVRTIVGVQLVHHKVGVVGAYSGAAVPGILQIWEAQEARLL